MVHEREGTPVATDRKMSAEQAGAAIPVRLVTGFVAGSIAAGLVGWGVFVASVVGLVGSLVAVLVGSRQD